MAGRPRHDTVIVGFYSLSSPPNGSRSSSKRSVLHSPLGVENRDGSVHRSEFSLRDRDPTDRIYGFERGDLRGPRRAFMRVRSRCLRERHAEKRPQ
ncbi:hypothetical protein BRC68_07940 [Halobacteriales archaeon QH_6_64_20]|nr:MAG: hypothetical protein BRC68_07940 [Halobacteriales archaeon QH_6_64_20]